MKKNLFCSLCILCVLFLGFSACSDDDDEDVVTIEVSETDFVSPESGVLEIPFTVKPATFAVTGTNLSIGVVSFSVSGTFFPVTLTGVTKGNKAGDWIAHVQFNGTGQAVINLNIDGKYASNSFKITKAAEEVYTAETIIWKRSDADFAEKESEIDLSEIFSQCGGVSGASSTATFLDQNGNPPLQDFCGGFISATDKTFTATMLDDESAVNGIWYWTYNYTRSDGSKFKIRFPLAVKE